MNDQWHDVIAFDDLPDGKPHGAEIGDTHIVLVRSGDTVQALEGICPHAGAKLEGGNVCDGHLVCPWHMGTFRISDGALLAPPALRGLTTYRTRIEDGRVHVDAEPTTPSPAHSLSSTVNDVLVVGSGAAACAATIGLRDYGFTGNLTVIGPEADEPIDRTQLSKMALAGKKSIDALGLLDPDTMTRLAITRVVDSVISVNPGDRIATTAGQQTYRFDQCIIATGAEPKKAVFPGADGRNIFTLRTAHDLKSILKSVLSAKHVVVLGTSFIALEAASAIRSRGIDVTVVGRAGTPFATRFGAKVAAAIQRLHERNGVKFQLGPAVVEARDNELGIDIDLEDATSIRADFAIVGYGVVPRTTFLHNLPQAKDGGIEVDAQLQVKPGVFAIGDIAAVPYRGGDRVRIEHWRVAEQHGFLAARNVLGAKESFNAMPFFWSQQHGKRLAYVGHASCWDDIAIDGDVDEMRFIAWYIKDGRVTAALTCGNEHACTVLIDRLLDAPTLAEARAAIS